MRLWCDCFGVCLYWLCLRRNWCLVGREGVKWMVSQSTKWFESDMNPVCVASSIVSSKGDSTHDREVKDRCKLDSLRYLEKMLPNGNDIIAEGGGVSKELRVMSFNVLSQTLLENHMYLYKNCDPVTLTWEYRYPRIISEIMAHRPHIICLQEVENYHLDYFSALEDYGYVGVYKRKTRSKIDGCSIYFKENMFSLISNTSVEYFRKGEQLLDRDNIGLVVRLFWWGGNRHIVVANTHLLYNPRRTDVRTAQIGVLISELNRITDYGRKNDLVLLTGDLNSAPSSPVVRLITDGRLDSSSAPYSSNVTHNFKWKSVHDNKTDRKGYDSEATTFQDRWLTADYIFYSTKDEDLRLLARARLPTPEECSMQIGHLPNFAHPSDHLPVVASFVLVTP